MGIAGIMTSLVTDIAPLERLLFDYIPGTVLRWRHYRDSGTLPRLRKPRTFRDKVIARIAYDRNPLLPTLQDKLAVRDFVRSRLGDDRILARMHAVTETSKEIERLKLPERFVMKPNHLSGCVKIVPSLREQDRAELAATARNWLRRNYFNEQLEWAYKDIPPRILFEELLEVNGEIPYDYKFYCFAGEPRFIQVDRNRFIDHRSNHYDPDFRPIPMRCVLAPPSETPLPPPPNLAAMLDIARSLSSGIDFIRVDLYDLGERVVFGELTLYPGGGYARLEPEEWEEAIGGFWP